MKILHTIALILLLIGGINWGLYGLLDIDLVQTLFETGPIAKAVYILVGVAAVYEAINWAMTCNECA